MVLAMGAVQAQINLYTFGSSAGTYSPIVGTTIVPANQDDGNAYVGTIGFPFNFNGTCFTEFRASSNGHIRLGTVASTVPIHRYPQRPYECHCAFRA
ncbi:MAG: hypothetical protein IPH05_07395 [Flavobacteriales bacterium]|nr:hypothetical protein [Flavobacteriales bacterium]